MSAFSILVSPPFSMFFFSCYVGLLNLLMLVNEQKSLKRSIEWSNSLTGDCCQLTFALTYTNDVTKEAITD